MSAQVSSASNCGRCGGSGTEWWAGKYRPHGAGPDLGPCLRCRKRDFVIESDPSRLAHIRAAHANEIEKRANHLALRDALIASVREGA